MTALAPLLLVLALLSRIAATPRITLTVAEGMLHVRLGFWDALYCVHRSLRIPLEQVHGVAAAPREQVPMTGFRLPGTGVPGVIRAGSYGTGARRDFWDVRRGSVFLVVVLKPGAEYRRLVLQVPDAHAEALRLRPLVGAYAGTFRD